MAVLEFAFLCNYQQTCPVGISQQPNGPVPVQCKHIQNSIFKLPPLSLKGANSRIAL